MVQANMVVFGANQWRETPSSCMFFERYYMAVNLGGMIATIYFPLVQTENSTPANDIFFQRFFIGACTLLFSVILFAIGYSYYIRIKTVNAVILNWFRIILNSCSSHFNSSLQEETDTHHINSCLDYANIYNGGHFHDREINEIKSFHRTLMVFFLLIPYWLVYAQVNHTNMIQNTQQQK